MTHTQVVVTVPGNLVGFHRLGRLARKLSYHIG